jgi:hypothetical protein
MRRSTLAFALAALCLLAVSGVRAQSCVPATQYSGLSITGSKCTYDSHGSLCAPGTPVTFTILTSGAGNPPPLPACPVEIKWSFGDGATATTTDTNTIEHAYTATGFYRMTSSAQVAGTPRADGRDLYIGDGYFDLNMTAPNVSEGTTANLIVTRSGDLSHAASVGYSTDSDTLVPASGTVDFAPGQSTRTFGVQVKDDTVWNEGEHRWATVFLHHPGTYLLLGSYYPNDVVEELPITFTIVDDDDPVRHRCTQPVTVSETAGFALVEIERTGNLANATTGSALIYGGGWELPFPYGTFSTQFAPGQAHATIQIPITNDHEYYGLQRTYVGCTGSGPGTQETTSEILLTVTEDEPFPVITAPASVEVDETDASQIVEIPYSIVPPFGRWSSLSLTLQHVTTSEDDAELVSAWYQNPIRIRIAGDDLPEADERMSVRLDGELSKSIPVIIRDDDRPLFPYAFDRDTYDFQEEYAAVTILRSGDRSAAANLVLHVRASAPMQLDDAFPVLFAPGEASKEVIIPVQDDWFTGPRTATLELDLDGFAGATASMTINDDESIPSLAIGGGSVREGGLDQKTRLEIPVTLSAPVGYDVKVGLTLTHISTDDADFVSTAPQTATIYAGNLSGTGAFEVQGDIDEEIDETFSVAVTSCCGGLAHVVGGTATATISNDDGAPSANAWRLPFGATEFPETAKWLTVPVQRFGRIHAAALAVLRLTGGGRVFTPRQVLFAPDETRKDVRFYINDIYFNGNADVRVELFEGEQLMETANVRIVDDEHVPLVWGNSVHVREGDGDGNVTFRINVTPPSPEPVTVHLVSRSGTAKIQSDFGVFDAEVEIPAHGSWVDVRVPITNDTVAEDDEYFLLDLVSAKGAATPVSYGRSISCGITDDDRGYLRYEPLVEAGTATTVTVELPGPAPRQEVSLISPSNPAVLEVPKTVLVPAGARSVTFQAQAHGEGQTSFQVVLPSFFDYRRLNATIVVGATHTLTVTPAALQLAPGATASVEVTISSDSTALSFLPQSADSAVAAVETNARTSPEPRTITVYGVNPGTTEITLTLPASAGGATVTLPVVVAEPSSRRHGVRH